MDSTKKLAVIVIGSESSGTRVLTQHLVEAGYYGDFGHEQRLDEAIPDDKNIIVFRRSIPHDGRMPNLSAWVDQARKKGYEVKAFVTKREWYSTIESQINAPHIADRKEGLENLRLANIYIYTHLQDLEIPYVEFQYEQAVLGGVIYLKVMAEMLDVAPFTFCRYVDNNRKYYQEMISSYIESNKLSIKENGEEEIIEGSERE